MLKQWVAIGAGILRGRFAAPQDDVVLIAIVSRESRLPHALNLTPAAKGRFEMPHPDRRDFHGRCGSFL